MISEEDAKTHLAATDTENERAACGKLVGPYLLGQSAEGIECKQCRRTKRFHQVAAEEGIDVEDDRCY